jgi:peptidoglycan/xylan/chitin deacetylase (PgdA/CDA1 family)
MKNRADELSRRRFVTAAVAGTIGGVSRLTCAEASPASRPAHIAITLDLEMSRHYPRREIMEWDFQKGNLDDATKAYAVQAAQIAKKLGGLIHFFCVGRVLEQPDISWLQEIATAGHPVGNHTYDHVNVLATEPEATQFRFQRAPWLVRGKTARQVIEENIRMTEIALDRRAKIAQRGFRTPGGFHTGLAERADVRSMLQGLGFTWVSSKYPRHQSGVPKQHPTDAVFADIIRAQADAQPFVYPDGLVEIPMSPISDVTAFRSHFWKLESYLKAVGQAVDWAIETGGVFDFLAHPSCLVVEDPSFEAIKLICRKVNQAGTRAAIVDLDTIARRLGV